MKPAWWQQQPLFIITCNNSLFFSKLQDTMGLIQFLPHTCLSSWWNGNRSGMGEIHVFCFWSHNL